MIEINPGMSFIKLTIQNGFAVYASVSDDGAEVLAGATDINVRTGLSASDDGDGTVTIDALERAIEDGGVEVVADATAIDFGTNLTVTDDGDGTVTVDAAGGSVEVQSDGATVVSQASVLDFVGDQFDVSNPAADEVRVGLASDFGSVTSVSYSPIDFEVVFSDADSGSAYATDDNLMEVDLSGSYSNRSHFYLLLENPAAVSFFFGGSDVRTINASGVVRCIYANNAWNIDSLDQYQYPVSYGPTDFPSVAVSGDDDWSGGVAVNDGVVIAQNGSTGELVSFLRSEMSVGSDVANATVQAVSGVDQLIKEPNLRADGYNGFSYFPVGASAAYGIYVFSDTNPPTFAWSAFGPDVTSGHLLWRNGAGGAGTVFVYDQELDLTDGSVVNDYSSTGNALLYGPDVYEDTAVTYTLGDDLEVIDLTTFTVTDTVTLSGSITSRWVRFTAGGRYIATITENGIYLYRRADSTLFTFPTDGIGIGGTYPIVDERSDLFAIQDARNLVTFDLKPETPIRIAIDNSSSITPTKKSFLYADGQMFLSPQFMGAGVIRDLETARQTGLWNHYGAGWASSATSSISNNLFIDQEGDFFIGAEDGVLLGGEFVFRVPSLSAQPLGTVARPTP